MRPQRTGLSYVLGPGKNNLNPQYFNFNMIHWKEKKLIYKSVRIRQHYIVRDMKEKGVEPIILHKFMELLNVYGRSGIMGLF